MIQFLISRFFTKDRALEILQDKEAQITEISEKNPQLAYAVKTGFKLWSLWRLFQVIWWSFLGILSLGCILLAYYLITQFF